MKDADAKKKLSFAIFWAMWQRDVTPPQLAKAIKKGPDAVRRWRDGDSSPSVLDVGPLARALGVRVDFFTNPPDLPDYPFEDYVIEIAEELVDDAVAEGISAGKRRARTPPGGEGPSAPPPSPGPRSRSAGTARR